ncbi:MAG: hypothetical protein LBD55_06820 [Treponema sp.]|jgi:epoxyqueuosine reductase|nr:hypothetical protein [Treponema sp.]
MVSDAGFARGRILVSFEPEEYGPVLIPERYRIGAPALLIASLIYGNLRIDESVPACENAAYIAPFAQRNYYREAVKRLQPLAREFRFRYGGAKSDFRILCNSPVPEKPLAAASGLGFPGRNGLIITPEGGSLIIIAAMTLPFTPEGDGPEEAARDNDFPLCKDCNPLYPPCVAACPTGAVIGNGTIERSRCIQWYASGNGDTIPQEVARNWGNRLYGCTGCQDACIHNKPPIRGVFSEEGALPAYMDPMELLAMTDEELKARFKGTALGLAWLGPQGIRRNARMILARNQLDSSSEGLFW